MGVRENAKGTVLAQRMDWPAQLFANAMQLVAATIMYITGMVKTRTRRKRGTLTDSRSSAKSLVNQYNMQVLINIFIFVDSCDSKCFMLYLN